MSKKVYCNSCKYFMETCECMFEPKYRNLAHGKHRVEVHIRDANRNNDCKNYAAIWITRIVGEANDNVD